MWGGGCLGNDHRTTPGPLRQFSTKPGTLSGIHIPKVEPGDGYVELEIDSLNLVPGRYSLSLWIAGEGTVCDGDVRASLEVEIADVYGSGKMLDSRHGLVYFPQRWKV